jgi:hypothetical protein
MAFQAEAKDYSQLHSACRARAEQLQASRLVLDELAGTASGWFGKFLGPRQVRRLGMASLGPALAALGLKFIVVEDPEQTARNADKLPRRCEFNVRRRALPDASPS